MEKFRCGECQWVGVADELLTAPNPFTEGDEEMVGCPQCREPNTMRRVCDEPDCWQEATCGTATLGRYRTTCGKHVPRANAELMQETQEKR